MNATQLLQARIALDRANEVRTYRARIKHHLAAGHILLSEVLRSENQLLDTMRVRDLLLATPHLGKTKVTRALAANRIGPSQTLEHFPVTRRESLLCWIRANHPAASA